MLTPPRFLFAALAGLALTPAASAAPAPESFLRTAWTTANGLPQNTVNAILQTRDGYLWVGTNGGLARFDGIAFTVFTVANTAGLRSNRIQALYEARDGIVWIGTELGGVARVQRGTFLPALTVREGLPSDRVFDFSETPAGDMWLATGVGVVRVRHGRVVETHSSRSDLPTSDDETWSVLADPDGGLWIGNNGGLFHLQNGSIARIAHGDVGDAHVRSLHRAKDGTLWVGMYSGGLARLEGAALRSVDPALKLVARMADAGDADLWAAASAGLARIRAGVVTRYDADELPDPNLRAIAVDREGDLWVGSNTGGLFRWRARPVAFLTRSDGLKTQGSFLPVFEDRGGRLWAGALCGGLNRLEHGRWTAFGSRDGLPADECMQSLGEDRRGSLWVGTAAGVFRLENGRFEPFAAKLKMPPDVRVHAIHLDPAGVLWFGSTVGLTRFAGESVATFRTRDGLVDDDVRFITDSRDGGLWVGTVGGASRYAGGTFVNYTKANGLSDNFVRAIREDDDGTVWMGTYGGGLNRLKSGRLVAITSRNGLFDDVVSAILEDGAGNFWMSGNRGVYRASRRGLNDVADGRAASVESIGYGASDGMTVTETNGGAQPAGWRTADGRLWFPTIGGLAIFDPDRLTNRLAPPVAIERVLVDGTPVDIGSGAIDVPAGARTLEIRYTGLSLAAPERMRFRYALEGYDPRPVDAGARRVAYYTNLPPGAYRFHVAASNSDGVWNDAGAAVALRQHPRFHQTLTFDLLAAAFAVALVGAGYRVRVRHLTRRTRELEQRVSARTAEVVERSNELARANDQLELLNAAIGAARDDMLSVLNQLRLGVALVEKSGKVTFLNRQARHLLDIGPEEAVERPWSDLLPLNPRDRAQIDTMAQLPRARRSRLPARIQTPSRRAFWMEIDVHDDPRDPDRRIFCLYDLSEVYDLRRLLDEKTQFHGLVGQSAAMQLVFKQVGDVAAVDTTVLIEGETGTGKELVARAIHYASARKARPFVAVNCAVLNESLVASQLFGHRRGAFTGAVADQMGVFESANGGTVFLDEIGDIPLATQTSLLRVLQEREITRVGENRPHKIDVRIVAATHRDLGREVAEGRFRGDLLYRIRVARIQLPALRDRQDDVPLLAAWFLGQTRAASGRLDLEIAQDTMDLLVDYSWPGNARELKSAIDSAAIRSRGSLIQPGDLPPEVLADTGAIAAGLPVSGNARLDLLEALARAKGNRAAAARALGIGRSTLYRRLRALGIEDDEPSAT